MYRRTMVYVTAFYLVAQFVPGAFASDFGCKAILCLASPGGPKQFQECVPVIEKLYRDLHNGKPFPSCDMGGSSDVAVEQGVQPFLTCRQAYGEGFEPSNPPQTQDTEQLNCNSMIVGDVSYEDGYNYNECTVCNKYVGTRMEYCCDGEGLAECQWVEVPQYESYPAKQNDDSRYVQVNVSGEKQGERLYYRVKK